MEIFQLVQAAHGPPLDPEQEVKQSSTASQIDFENLLGSLEEIFSQDNDLQTPQDIPEELQQILAGFLGGSAPAIQLNAQDLVQEAGADSGPQEARMQPLMGSILAARPDLVIETGDLSVLTDLENETAALTPFQNLNEIQGFEETLTQENNTQESILQSSESPLEASDLLKTVPPEDQTKAKEADNSKAGVFVLEENGKGEIRRSNPELRELADQALSENNQKTKQSRSPSSDQSEAEQSRVRSEAEKTLRATDSEPHSQQEKTSRSEVTSEVKDLKNQKDEFLDGNKLNEKTDRPRVEQETQPQPKAGEALDPTGFSKLTFEETLDLDPTDQISVKIEEMLEKQQQRLRLQLRPRDMGGIEIQLTKGEDGVQVNIQAESQKTAVMLEQHLNDLKTSLSQSGIKLQDLTVGQGNQEAFQSHQHPASDQRQPAFQPEVTGGMQEEKNLSQPSLVEYLI